MAPTSASNFKILPRHEKCKNVDRVPLTSKDHLLLFYAVELCQKTPLHKFLLRVEMIYIIKIEK